MDVVVTNAGQILEGLITTLVLALVSFTSALILGALLGLLRILPFGIPRFLGDAYVNTVRNMPLLLIVIVSIFVLPQLGLTLPLEVCVAGSLAGYFACYIADIFRSGIQTVDIGQVEAARALGLGNLQTIRLIVAPQAVRSMVQPLGTMFIATLLSTAIGSIVGVIELSGVTRLLNVQYAEPLAIFGITATIYILLALTIGFVTGRIERKVRVQR